MASIPSPIRKWVGQFVDSIRGEPEGLAELSDGGVLKSSQLPDLAITETSTVADEAERLDLDVEEGDVAIQEDNDTAYIFTGGDPSDDSNWSTIEFDVPVTSVFGREGDVEAESGDYTFDQIDDRQHGNEDHDSDYYAEGDDATFGELEATDKITIPSVDTEDDLPDVEKPAIFYVDGENEYYGSYDE